jgi:hypothetical protein
MMSMGEESPATNYSAADGTSGPSSFTDGLRHDLGSIRTGTRQAYREKLVAESLLKQLRIETLDVLNKCRTEINEFRTSSKSRMKVLSESSHMASYSGVDGDLGIGMQEFLPPKKALHSDEYVQSLENKVAELTIALQKREATAEPECDDDIYSGRRHAESTDISVVDDAPAPVDDVDDVDILQSELARYRTLATQSNRELKVSTTELLNLRSANQTLLRELNSSRQEGSVLRVRVIELEGLLEGLQQRTLPDSLLQIGNGESKAFDLVGSSSKRSPVSGEYIYTTSSPIRIAREPNGTSKEISQLLASVDLILSTSPQRTEGKAADASGGAEALMSVQLVDEFMNT